ncbi:MAG: 3-hydroxyacyl-CoA dehydrogenase NAD-binding domain-containing protein [Planctomycetota bacterium]
MTMSWDDLPAPKDAPEPGACWRIERPEEGLIHLILDPPHRPKLAVFDMPAMRDLNLALDEIEGDASARALVVMGRSPLSFAGGADIEAIGEVTDTRVAAELARRGQETFTRIEKLGREAGGRLFTVAAAGGPVPGGACELTLVCDRSVLADDPKTRIGLPEVKLGILPAWGGTSRLPRRIGVPAATTAILTGRLYRARQAKKLGIVDRITKPEYLVRVATDIAMGRAKCARHDRGWKAFAVDKNPIMARFVGGKATKGVMEQTRGKYPAPLAVIPLVVEAPGKPLEESLEDEIKAITPLATSPVTASLVGLFQLSEDAKKLGKLEDGTSAAGFRRGAVVGAGVMGGAIASLMAERGIAARLSDLDQAALDRAVRTHRADVDKKRKRRRLQRHEADRATDLLETTSDQTGFGRCEIVIEAVAEVLEVKRKVLGGLAAAMPDGAILATNTSSLSVDDIAAELPSPERVIGMHFFNPVKKMPLVEIIRGARTSDETVARTAKLALDLGKTPVVCKDVAGFLVNRLLGPYLDEAVRLAQAGCDLEAVDAAMLDFGMPMGPFELLDEVGLDIAAHAASSLEAAYGERMIACDYLAPLVERGDLGKKTGTGIFSWSKENGRPVNGGRNPALPEPAQNLELSDGEVVDRLVGAMLAEGVRALEEEVVAGPRELDLATVFGMGFAPFRGGLLRYADARGLDNVVAGLKRVAEAPGVRDRKGGPERFAPAALIVELAGKGGRFHG